MKLPIPSTDIMGHSETKNMFHSLVLGDLETRLANDNDKFNLPVQFLRNFWIWNGISWTHNTAWKFVKYQRFLGNGFILFFTMINIVHANAQNFVWFGDGSSQIDIAKRDFCQLVFLNQAENIKYQSVKVDKISDIMFIVLALSAV